MSAPQISTRPSRPPESAARWRFAQTIVPRVMILAVAGAFWNYSQDPILCGTRFLSADRESPANMGIDPLPTFPMSGWAQIPSPLR